jgi:hypothetical protein
MGHSLESTNHVRNVFVEKWPSLVKCVLVAGAALFIFCSAPRKTRHLGPCLK